MAALRPIADVEPRPLRPPPPAPLLAPAAALIAGICLNESFASSQLAAGGAASGGSLFRAAAILAAAAVLASSFRDGRTPTSAALRAAVLALMCLTGIVRHGCATKLGNDHVVRHIGAEPVLTKIAAEVVTVPIRRPAERRNPFLGFPPSGSTSFVAAAREIRSASPAMPASGLIQVRVGDGSFAGGGTKFAPPPLQPGDRVVLTGRLERPRGPRNIGEIDWAEQLRLDGILVRMSLDDGRYVLVEGRAGGWWARFRARLSAWSRAVFLDPDASTAEDDAPARLLDAIVLGQRSATGPRINEAFVRTGTVHILSVSGFHVGVLAGVCWLILRRALGRGVRAASAVTLVVLLLFALIVEWNAPVVRSLIMAGLACAAGLIRRPVSSLNWLAASAIAVLLWNPLELFRAGFQLSFVQVLALLWFVRPLYRVLTGANSDDVAPRRDAHSWKELAALWFGRSVLGLAVVSAVAWIAAAPLTLFHFGQVTPWGALHSMLLVPLFAGVITLGFLAALLSWAPLVGAAIASATLWLTGSLFVLVQWLATWPGSRLEFSPPSAGTVLFLYATVLAWRAVDRSWRAGRGVAPVPTTTPPRDRFEPRRIGLRLGCASVVVVQSSWWLAGVVSAPPPHWQAQMLSVGNGSALLVTTSDGHAAVFDAGTIANFDAGETVRRVAGRAGVRRLDAAIVSHENYDHYSGLPTLLADVPTTWLGVNPYYESLRSTDYGLRLLERHLPRTAPPRTALTAGDSGEFGALRFDVLWPPSGLDHWSANERSLVIRLTGGGATMLITGDIERDAMQALLDAHRAGAIDLRADVLIAPHHGSVLPQRHVTAEFYSAVRPNRVLVSSGNPRPELIELVNEVLGAGCSVLSTRDVGAIVVTIRDRGAIDVATPFAPGEPADGANDPPRDRR